MFLFGHQSKESLCTILLTTRSNIQTVSGCYFSWGKKTGKAAVIITISPKGCLTLFVSAPLKTLQQPSDFLPWAPAFKCRQVLPFAA